jgi:hypothetical protein
VRRDTPLGSPNARREYAQQLVVTERLREHGVSAGEGSVLRRKSGQHDRPGEEAGHDVRHVPEHELAEAILRTQRRRLGRHAENHGIEGIAFPQNL